MHNYMCNNKTEMKTIVYIYRKCVFLFIKKKMKTVGKTPYQQSVYLFIITKKNINEKFQKKTKQINPSWWNVPTLVVLQLQSD